VVTGGFRHGMPPPGEPRRVPFGEGVTPFAAAFRKLAEMNFNGPILLEMWNDDAPDSLKVVEEARCWVEAQMVEGGLITHREMNYAMCLHPRFQLIQSMDFIPRYAARSGQGRAVFLIRPINTQPFMQNSRDGCPALQYFPCVRIVPRHNLA